MASDRVNQLMKEAGLRGIVPGLASISRLLAKFDNPQDEMDLIHVVGTNGKGSVTAFLANGLWENEIPVGRFMSPAVYDPMEMFWCKGHTISDSEYKDLLEEINLACQKICREGFDGPTIFEIQVCLALVYFQRNGCKIAVLEAGMGGSLDATNVGKGPAVCVFTPIGMDHVKYLGSSVREIAESKGRILKSGDVCFSAPQSFDAETVLKSICSELSVKGSFLDASEEFSLPLSMEGKYQRRNAALAEAVLEWISQNSYPLSPEKYQLAISKTRLPGRLELVGEDPAVYFDGAHNLPAALALRDFISTEFTNQKVTFIIGVLSDKDYGSVLKEWIPLADHLICVTPKNPRALTAEALFEKALSLKEQLQVSCQVDLAEDFQEAVRRSEELSPDVIFVCGTFTHLRELREDFLHYQQNPEQESYYGQ